MVALASAVLLSLTPSVEGAHAEPLRVGVSRSAHSSLIYVAEAQGFFKKQGLDVIIKEYELSLESVNDLVADKVDIATAGEFAFVMRSFQRRDLRIPAVISKASDMDLIVRKDRGIARPQDLKGKRVAVARGGQAEFFLYNYLIFNRIPAEGVQIVYHTPSEMVKAMADGTVDAALCWPPYTTEMEKQLGATGCPLARSKRTGLLFALFAKEGFLKKQPKMMEQFLAALLEAEGFIAKYPDRAQAILRQRLKAWISGFPRNVVTRPFPAPVDPGPARPHGTGGKVGDPQQTGKKERDAQLSRFLLL